MSFRVLSTKLLSPSQQQLLLNANIAFVHASFIRIERLPFDCEAVVENAIFTSKNALLAVVEKSVEVQNAFCVGPKTRNLAETKGYTVLESARDAESLAKVLIEKYAHKTFVFFSGAKRRDILPEILRSHEVSFREVTVYNTVLTPKTFSGSYDGILFFSPSAVESYVKYNSLHVTPCFCIGETTAIAAKKYNDQVIVANTPSVENVLIQVIKYSKENTN
ncbi:uroporphyrinogen-III synthase [Flavobacteriaceae bacterium M23B6Z8]